jgi:hypothetical protein
MLGVMKAKRMGIVWLVLCAALPICANTQFRARKMTRTDVPAGKGQCDIRLRVDNEVEVTVRGDFVYIRTISGQDGRDDGSECNAPLPNRRVEDFRFENVESRGEVRLVAEPSRETDFQAVVHIRDGEAGEGRYHFRLSWRITDGPDRGGLDHPGDRDDGRGGLAWNNALHFGGRGHGTSTTTGYNAQRLSDVNVDIDRAGKILVSFRTESGPLSFSGSVIDFDPGSVRADVATDDHVRLRGSMVLSRNEHGEIYRVSLDATNGQDRLHLDWDRR